ncbi:hypothetical protein [Vibrio sp. HN007]|uniref:hypothetical protein n=1 Tax=Vibrio iocasae TaxID=3098914 RepID=UPI0035D3F687
MLIQLLPQIELVSDEGIYLVCPTKSKTKATEIILEELKKGISEDFAQKRVKK